MLSLDKGTWIVHMFFSSKRSQGIIVVLFMWPFFNRAGELNA
jgi:hypothetical protein